MISAPTIVSRPRSPRRRVERVFATSSGATMRPWTTSAGQGAFTPEVHQMAESQRVWRLVKLEFGTPALVFPATSLLLLAYTNRYMAIVSRLRQLADELSQSSGRMSVVDDESLVRQIAILRRRIGLIRGMQTLGVTCMLAAVVAMFLLASGAQTAARIALFVGLLSLAGSLGVTLWEIQLSNDAVDEQLAAIERSLHQRRKDE